MTHASLFSGIGGFDLAAKWAGFENLFHCEWIESKRKHLEYKFPNSVSYGDITTTDFREWRDRITILSGGFPCQDASIAKQDGEGQQGLQGSRTGLFYQFVRAIEEVHPKYIIAENVANILKTNKGRDFGQILHELARMGYNVEWRVCRASDVGAPHHRARLYLVAYSSIVRQKPGFSFFSNVHEEVAPFSWCANGATIQIVRGGAWNSEPPSLCVDDGLPRKLVREQLHGYGNAIVPQIAFRIFEAIKSLEV
jgi:DNA (cytosine-5)-methyltransferase 1